MFWSNFGQLKDPTECEISLAEVRIMTFVLLQFVEGEREAIKFWSLEG